MLYVPNKSSKLQGGSDWNTTIENFQSNAITPVFSAGINGGNIVTIINANSDVYGFTIHLTRGSTGYTAGIGWRIEISTDAVNWTPITETIVTYGFMHGPNYGLSYYQRYLPLFIPKDYWIGIRMIGTSSSSVSVGITYDTQLSDTAYEKVGSYTERVGVNAGGDHLGLPILTAAGYNSLGITQRDWWYTWLGMNIIDSTQNNESRMFGYYIGDGSGNYTPILPEHIYKMTTNENNYDFDMSPYLTGISRFIPAGSELFIYNPSSVNSTIYVSAYGVGG